MGYDNNSVQKSVIFFICACLCHTYNYINNLSQELNEANSQSVRII